MMDSKTLPRMTSLMGLAVMIGLSASTSATAAYSTAVAGYTQGSVNFGPTQSLGFDFKAKSAIVVNELGAYEASSTSITSGQTVVLYDLTTSTVVASTTLTGGFTTGNFNYGGIAATTLNTTDTYSIFSVFQSNNTQYGAATTLTFSPDITIVPIGGANTGFTQGSASVPPTSAYANLLAVDFQYAPAAVVPEPASVALLGLGVAGLGFGMMRRRYSK